MKASKTILKHIFVTLFVAFFALAFGPFYLESSPKANATGITESDILEFDGTYDWETNLDVKTTSSDYITYYCLAATSASACASAANGKYIRFDTAEELYRFSMDVSFEEIYETGNPTEDVKLANDKIAVLLSLDYVLGNNIDYSVMQSKAFIPIGYAFTDVDENVYERSFTGTFNGQGFEIRNLYVAGYDHLIYVDQIDESTTIDIAMSQHYAMFNYNEGTIENLGLINPNLEILELHTDITKLSNLVGFNMSSGIVRNVYVIDNRTTVTTAGIRYAVGTSSEDFQAAGIVHTNQGTFMDAYYVSLVVVNGNYINKFDVQPVLYTNSGGTISHLVYDSEKYLLQVTVGSSTFIIDTPNGLATGETTNMLKSTSSSLNNYSLSGSDISFTSSTSTIASSTLDFSIFQVGDSVWVSGSSSNDGEYTIASIPTSNSITVSESLTDESAGSSITVKKEVWYFYSSDGYPLLQGFHYDSTDEIYLITNPVDFVFFARVIQFDSYSHGSLYAASDFLITADLDMSTLAPDAYVIPTDTFTGSLSGYNPLGSDNSDNYYIYNLNIDTNISRGTDYYGGLFSILGAGSEVSYINFSQSSVSFTDTEAIYSYTFYIGAIAGRLIGGTISNVMVDVDLDLGDEAIGKTYAGGIVGKASGVIEYTSTSGNIYVNEHTYSSSYSIKSTYNIGGVVGAVESAKLVITDVVNHGDIYGFETSSDITLATGFTQVTVRIGGVIGYIYNITNNLIEMTDVANFGDIYLQSVKYSVSVPSYQYAGGVFGIQEGLAPDLEADSEYLFANFYNIGDIHHTYVVDTAIVKAAGIGVNNTSAATEYALLFNHGTFDFTEGAATYSQTQFNYVTLIYDISSSALTISRSYNYGDLDLDSNIYYNISGLVYSSNDNSMTLNFVANYGDINYLSNSGATQMTLATSVYITGITRNTNVDYLNVYNYGNINFVNINVGSYSVYIAGFATQLTSGNYIKNSLNDGDITVAEISGSGNIYVAGLVNTNFSGDLQDPEQSSTQPIATIGILNSLNSGNISTSYGLEAAGLYGIHGTSNAFLGGLVTLNSGSIQNSANFGNISGYNSNASSTYNYETATYYAGLSISYTSGIVAGGVAAGAISSDSRIYDTANNGDVLLITYRYVRAGGVLGVALYDEFEAGGITSGMGLSNDIEDSVLSNGLNLGKISALSYYIGTYETGSYTYSAPIYHNGSTSGSIYELFYTTNATDDRPQINASAGGVIGYGLSVMQNMLNHGTISSTDVAGGIVGATYALGSSSGSYTTVVNITTAINYGDVKAVLTSSLSSINLFDLDFTDVESVYLADGNTFIFPSSYSREMPADKRGFGGIFGRLQRGTNGVMTSEGGTFDFIVNANPNIDLIGRLDQVMNFTSSSRYFRFNDAIYYSAKLNDTTQVVFTGYYYTYARIVSRTGSNPYYYTATANQVYEQVGSVSTYIGNYGETINFYSNYNYNTGSNYYAYYAPLTVPWITEDPTDPNITNADDEYIYDADFPMRTNTSLTEYIYYMPNNLLAPRFTSSRTNGMYVLSTSAGQSFGSVIPKNIDISYIRMINEDYTGYISLDMDYNVVSPVIKTDLDTTIEDGYLDLRQTTFNDKAEVIPSDSVYVTIEEDGGSNSVISNPDIDYVNKTITFSISMEAYNSSQTTATYNVTTAPISSYALIAIRPYDYYGYTPSTAELQALRADLYDEKDDVISTEDPAILTVTLPSHDITSNVTLSIGYFSVYSEAFLGDNLYATTGYYNDYEVLIEFTPTLDLLPGTTQIEDVSFNGGGSVVVTDPTDVRSLGDVNSMGSITFYFEDNKGVFTQGYDFKTNFVLKYYDGTTVSSSYYSVTSTPVNISGGIGYYNITFTFINGTKTGDYYFEYSYFPTSTVYSVYFDKDPSSASSILDFTYYSEEDSISYNGYVITSYVNLGTTIDMDTSLTNYTSTTNSQLPTYVSNVTWDIDFMTAGSLSISPFATIVEARLISLTITDGYKTYLMEYIVQAEDGSTQSVYTHSLIERTVDLTSVLKDGNEVEMDSIDTTREALLTEFALDYGLDSNLSLYIMDPSNYYGFDISVTATTNDGLTTYDPSEIVGISYSVDDLLYLNMTYETLPGIYTFTVIYYRDGSSTDYVTFQTDLVITKNLGTDAYLSDIKFSELANETTYPTINIVDVNGDIITSPYSPAVYFEGIDYDGADDAGYPYYKVDGKVSNVPLDSFVPYFLDYLPFGATISRYAYDTNTSTWYWTTEADASSSSAVLAELATDYTRFPDTLLEPEEGEEVVTKFRVTAEDGVTEVYYYITVTDVTFNLSIVFDIYYCTGTVPDSCVLANQSASFNDELVIINVKNIQTDGDDTVWGVTDPDDFPSFTQVLGLNNKMVQFYDTSATEYRYKFGRNMAGFYTFDVELPLDEYLNDLYTYEIQIDEYYLNDASDNVAGLRGKYFYIEYATSNRTRRFNVYISPISSPETTQPYGLFDFFKSWFT